MSCADVQQASTSTTSSFMIEEILGIGSSQQKNTNSSKMVDKQQEETDEGGQQAKRKRTAFSNWQISSLETYFREVSYPDTKCREYIARTVGLDPARVQVWFQNRRARYRKRENPNGLQRHIIPLVNNQQQIFVPVIARKPDDCSFNFYDNYSSPNNSVQARNLPALADTGRREQNNELTIDSTTTTITGTERSGEDDSVCSSSSSSLKDM